MNSIASGAIFPPSLGHDLSRNAFVVSILFPERISLRSMDVFHDTKNIINFENVLSASDLLNLGGPAGGSAPGKVLRPQEGILHDS